MAQKETELALVLRELVSCDVFAPEHHFDGDRLVKQGADAGGAKSAKDILVPVDTFWRPVTLGEYYVDPDADEGRQAEQYYERLRAKADKAKGKDDDRASGAAQAAAGRGTFLGPAL